MSRPATISGHGRSSQRILRPSIATTYANCPVPLPPLSVQRQIVERVAKRREEIARLKADAKSLRRRGQGRRGSDDPGHEAGVARGAIQWRTTRTKQGTCQRKPTKDFGGCSVRNIAAPTKWRSDRSRANVNSTNSIGARRSRRSASRRARNRPSRRSWAVAWRRNR